MARNNTGDTAPVCVIVGVGPLLGAALAHVFADAGFALGLVARDNAKLQLLADTLTKSGAKVAHAAADARDEIALGKAIGLIEAELGPTEILVVNAFNRQTARPSDLKGQEALQAVKDNLLPAISAVQVVLPGMLERRQGVILVSGGRTAVDCPVDLAPLGVGKAALRNYTMTLAKNVAQQGIRVAHITIWDHIRPGTNFAPNAIAESYLAFAKNPDRRESDFIFDGKGDEKKKQS